MTSDCLAIFVTFSIVIICACDVHAGDIREEFNVLLQKGKYDAAEALLASDGPSSDDPLAASRILSSFRRFRSEASTRNYYQQVAERYKLMRLQVSGEEQMKLSRELFSAAVDLAKISPESDVMGFILYYSLTSLLDREGRKKLYDLYISQPDAVRAGLGKLEAIEAERVRLELKSRRDALVGEGRMYRDDKFLDGLPSSDSKVRDTIPKP